MTFFCSVVGLDALCWRARRRAVWRYWRHFAAMRKRKDVELEQKVATTLARFEKAVKESSTSTSSSGSRRQERLGQEKRKKKEEDLIDGLADWNETEAGGDSTPGKPYSYSYSHSYSQRWFKRVRSSLYPSIAWHPVVLHDERRCLDEYEYRTTAAQPGVV